MAFFALQEVEIWRRSWSAGKFVPGSLCFRNNIYLTRTVRGVHLSNIECQMSNRPIKLTSRTSWTWANAMILEWVARRYVRVAGSWSGTTHRATSAALAASRSCVKWSSAINRPTVSRVICSVRILVYTPDRHTQRFRTGESISGWLAKLRPNAQINHEINVFSRRRTKCQNLGILLRKMGRGN